MAVVLAIVVHSADIVAIAIVVIIESMRTNMICWAWFRNIWSWLVIGLVSGSLTDGRV